MTVAEAEHFRRFDSAPDDRIVVFQFPLSWLLAGNGKYKLSERLLHDLDPVRVDLAKPMDLVSSVRQCIPSQGTQYVLGQSYPDGPPLKNGWLQRYIPLQLIMRHCCYIVVFP